MGQDKKAFLDQLKGEYDRVYSSAEIFGVDLARQINAILQNSGIKTVFPVQFRVKDWASIQNKLDRITLKIKNIHDLQDLIGLRVILLSPKDADKVCLTLESHFKISRSYNTLSRLKEDQFGYASIHYIISSRDNEQSWGYLENKENLLAEIQVRTLAQHIWAETSHLTQYKNKGTLPKSTLRSIYRISALLEVIDEELTRIFEQLEANNIKQTNGANETNMETLEKNLYGELVSASLDVDNDGQKEIVVPSSKKDSSIYIFKNKEGVTRPLPVEQFKIHGYLSEIRLIDIDGDGLNEVMCVFEFDIVGNAIAFLKHKDNTFILLRKRTINTTTEESGTFDNPETESYYRNLASFAFFDATVEDANENEAPEIISEPWEPIPSEFLPPEYANQGEGEQAWGRVSSIWKWNKDTGLFILADEKLKYIGGR